MKRAVSHPHSEASYYRIEETPSPNTRLTWLTVETARAQLHASLLSGMKLPWEEKDVSACVAAELEGTHQLVACYCLGPIKDFVDVDYLEKTVTERVREASLKNKNDVQKQEKAKLRTKMREYVKLYKFFEGKGPSELKLTLENKE